ncbi:MAG: hypothetical protein KDA89_00430 [Planctomycetaceae bacterium]|nr:hypothetical protein [Planctomycetaceae bacterium]MCA9047160.1 hypothetical protein [Planctomycetaceae bacterium]
MNKKNQRKGGNMDAKNLVLAACTLLAVGVMTASDAAAQQCRTGVGTGVYNNGGYGYNTGYRGYGNNYNVGSNFNNRYNAGYGAANGYNGYSNSRSSLSLGLGYNNGSGDSRYNTGYNNRNLNSRAGYGSGYYGNTSQQPVAYRHGDHVDVEDGNRRFHVTGRGF